MRAYRPSEYPESVEGRADEEHALKESLVRAYCDRARAGLPLFGDEAEESCPEPEMTPATA